MLVDEAGIMLENSSTLGLMAILGLGLIFGLKHATEVDHVVAISTIVSRHKNIFRSAFVGALWGAGHTLSLMAIAIVVLWFRIAIPARVRGWLEFGVALMIIGLGVSALWRAWRSDGQMHVHQHTHGGLAHTHVHFHEDETRPERSAASQHSHRVSLIGWKPVMVGMMHGLAGSGALTLLVLTQISSAWVGLLYVLTFGVGSIAGMLLMSGLIGLPFALSSRNLTQAHQGLQTLAAVL